MSRPEVKECLGDINICVSQKQYTQIFSRFYAFIQWLQQHHRENLDVMGVQNFFSNMVRFRLLPEGQAPEETVEKLQACETVFQKNLGISVQQYIYHTRIEQAKEYLNDFRLKIYEVAELTGFNSSTHFNIVFKKIMRCTPAEYRNGLKQ